MTLSFSKARPADATAPIICGRGPCPARISAAMLLVRARPRHFSVESILQPMNLSYLKLLIRYWRERFDWRVAEREIDSFSHHKTEIEGIPIHFIHLIVRGGTR
jgi:hypothetical protein